LDFNARITAARHAQTFGLFADEVERYAMELGMWFKQFWNFRFWQQFVFALKKEWV
jgi:hypothetical protein